MLLVLMIVYRKKPPRLFSEAEKYNNSCLIVRVCRGFVRNRKARMCMNINVNCSKANSIFTAVNNKTYLTISIPNSLLICSDSLLGLL